MSVPTVFISYSHQDESWKDKLLPHLHALQLAGVGMNVWHDRKIDGGDTWYPEILQAMDSAAVAILLISPHFLASPFCIQEEVPALLKRHAGESLLLIPVMLRKCQWQVHRWLSVLQVLPRDDKCVAIDFPGDLADMVFDAVAGQVLGHFKQLAAHPAARGMVPAQLQRLAEIPRVPADPRIVPPPAIIDWPVVPPEHIDLTRLPATGSALFGRDAELALLDQAWASGEPAGAATVRILGFTAHGGVGKSTLVNHWLAEMEREHYRGATRVFGWSFYSQGVRGETAASADAFIDQALRFFGDADPTAGSPWSRGERLAHLVGSQRALLVLDGLEPLQSAHKMERGKLRDPALETLLRNLARGSAGLCVLTTREPLPDLAGRAGVNVRDLEQIDAQAGRALLRIARVVGTDLDLEALAKRFGPHALAVSLLGVYLREQPGHDIAPASVLEKLPGKEPIDRVLAGFEAWLGDSPERQALLMLGLFDRPADAGCLRALRAAPAIPGATERLVGLSDPEWDRVLARLEKLRLAQVQESSSGRRSVDAHPLLREHFAAILKESPAWREGHRRLYEHLCATTSDLPQPKLEDLEPLYQAVAHGCQAGMQQEACECVYRIRIARGQAYYSVKRLGAFGSDLGAVAWFFEKPWSRVSSMVSQVDQAWLLGVASFRLRALGRLTEALEPLRASLAIALRRHDSVKAAIRANYLSELELTRGEVAGALEEAERAVNYAERSGDPFQQMTSRTTHADALHHAGRPAAAEAHFRKAEDLQADIHPKYLLLHSLRGFQYCELLLAAPERTAWQRVLQASGNLQPSSPIEVFRAVGARATQSLKLATLEGLLLDIALDHLTLGRAALYQAILEGSDLESCRVFLEDAVDGLRRAGAQHHLPRGLLTRAWLRFLTGSPTGPQTAQEDLDEARDIAERGPMPLFLADMHLHRARLFRDRAALPEARKLIEKHGYGRRKDELEDAEAAAKYW